MRCLSYEWTESPGGCNSHVRDPRTVRGGCQAARRTSAEALIRHIPSNRSEPYLEANRYGADVRLIRFQRDGQACLDSDICDSE